MAAASLPDDALVGVFSRLPVKCLHRSKCVCKRWHNIIADPLHGKILPQTLVGFFTTILPSTLKKVRCSRHKFVNLLGTSPAPPPLLDPSFAFLDELPAGIECSQREIADSCKGLLLFQYGQLKLPESMGYIVFNPATEQRVVVPGIWTAQMHPRCLFSKAYLLFDPAVSSHFHIIVFCEEEEVDLITVHAYSSETRAWSHSEKDWSAEEQHRPTEAWRRCNGVLNKIYNSRGVFVNGLLYVYMLMDDDYDAILLSQRKDYATLELDVEGKTQSIIPVPSPSEDHDPSGRVPPFLFGQSQGQLHRISHESSGCNLSIWVIEDHGTTTTTKQWVLKYTVSCVQLFGRKCYDYAEYNVFAIHPDCNTLFILNSYTQKLISYDVDSNIVRDLCTLNNRYVSFSPYVPCFIDLLSN